MLLGSARSKVTEVTEEPLLSLKTCGLSILWPLIIVIEGLTTMLLAVQLFNLLSLLANWILPNVLLETFKTPLTSVLPLDVQFDPEALPLTVSEENVPPDSFKAP